ncbi:MAG: CO dehydrogenase/acetyl-CoA synthase complex subunit alpha [Candidatus Baldrarchaeia archaeon]
MSGESLRLKATEVQTTIGVIKGLEVAIGAVIEEEEEWEPMGPTPFPKVTDLRSWDMTLLKRYKPFYAPFCDLCCLCTYGKCDLTAGKRGACGLDIGTQQGRIVLLACLIGLAAHAGHARHLWHYLVEKFGRNVPVDLGGDIAVEAPHTRLICGFRPKTIGDFDVALKYVEEQLVQLLSATHTGQEGNYLDFESKALHVGMLDHLAMEIADIIQIVALNFPKGDPDAPLVEIGFGTVDRNKPVILCIGHNVAPAVEIVDYLREHNLYDKVEVCGVCCTAHDMTRYYSGAKIIGPLSRQLRYIRTGIPDVIIVDEQCIRADIVREAQRIHAPVVATNEKKCEGLPDRTHDPIDEIVDDLVNFRVPGVFIEDPRKAAELVVKTAIKIAPLRKQYKTLPSKEELIELAKKCTNCKSCRRACPNDYPVNEAVQAAKNGDLSKLAELAEVCVGCGRCESACPRGIPIFTLMTKAAEAEIEKERYKIRAGRGPIKDTEIRNVGAPIVLGEIPGVVAYIGCPNYPGSYREVAEMAEEFLRRRYIVVASGCEAMDIARYLTEEGKGLYEVYPGDFDAGCLVNVGSCVANAHISGAAIKIASIFARRNLRGNYEEIADYILNRVGAVGVAWGAMSQKAASIATGFNRLGIPAIVGPHGSKYRRAYLGRPDREEDWYVYDARTGEKVYAGPAPEHLIYPAESKEEAMVMTAKLCIRPNDTTKGRAIKLAHYIDLHKKFFGGLPEDLHLFVRTEADIPITMKDEVLEFLKEKGWKPMKIPDPTLLPRLIRRKAK